MHCRVTSLKRRASRLALKFILRKHTSAFRGTRILFLTRGIFVRTVAFSENSIKTKKRLLLNIESKSILCLLLLILLWNADSYFFRKAISVTVKFNSNNRRNFCRSIRRLAKIEAETKRVTSMVPGEKWNLFDVKSKWNAWWHSRRHNGGFYPDYERESRNSMKRFIGSWMGDPNRFSKPEPLDPLIVHSLTAFFLVRNGVSPALRFLSHWTVKYYASSASAEGAGILAFDLLQARNDAISLIAFFSISSHTMNSLVCVLLIYHEGYSGRHPHICATLRFQKICRRIGQLFIAVTNYIFYFRTLNVIMSA